VKKVHELSFLNATRSGTPERVALPFFTATTPAKLGGFSSIIATGDLQGRMSVGGELLGIAVARELRTLAELGEITPLNDALVLLAGDFWSDEAVAKRGGMGDVMPVWETFEATGATVLGVGGNHDAFISGPPAGLLDWGIAEVGGIRVAGVSGIIGNPRRPMRRTYDNFGKEVSRLAGKKPDWIVLHEPPHIGDGQEGQFIILDAMVLNDYRGGVICGHHRWQDPVAALGGIWCCNVDSRVMILTKP